MTEQIVQAGLQRIAGFGPPWLRRVGLLNLVGTAILTAGGAVLVSSPGNDGGPIALVLMIVSTLPLLAFRRQPGFATLVTAAGVLSTQLAAGPLVTCGTIFPLVCVMAFQLGVGTRPPTQTRFGLIGLAATVVVEGVWDPALGLEGGVFIGGVALGFGVAGLVLRSRTQLVERLRLSTAELVRQRDRTAEIAVAADRARIGSDLDAAVRTRIDAIASAAASGRRSIADGANGAAVAALTEVEQQGRETLGAMRGVVGSLQQAPVQPPPGIADLPGLIGADPAVGLRVDHDPSLPLGANLDLTVYRIVEQLLAAINGEPGARVEVDVSVDQRAVRLQLESPGVDPAGRADDAARMALAAAATRAEVVGGRLASRIVDGRRRTTVVLPMAASAAS